jgi:hypothetical protein
MEGSGLPPHLRNRILRNALVPANAVLVQRRREASLEAVITTVQLEANADCDSGICSLQR